MQKWLHVLKVRQIQKQAVSRFYLPEAENDTTARYKLLMKLALDNPEMAGEKTGLMVDKAYWAEIKFQGKLSIHYWLNNGQDEMDESLFSFKEVLESESKKQVFQ